MDKHQYFFPSGLERFIVCKKKVKCCEMEHCHMQRFLRRYLSCQTEVSCEGRKYIYIFYYYYCYYYYCYYYYICITPSFSVQ